MTGWRKGRRLLNAAGIGIAVLLVLLRVYAPAAAGAQETGPTPITLAYCTDCVPFQFTDRNGRPAGLIIDIWRVWSDITGTPVEYRAAAWSQTLRMVKEGEAQAHAGLFRNAERDVYLDFGAALTKTDTHVFQHRSLPPLTDLSNLAAYRVGVLSGDFVEGYLKERLPGAAIVGYDDYRSLMADLKLGALKVFAADTPPGIFHLRDQGVLAEFAFSNSQRLYQNAWHVAVGEGNTALLARIDHGMARISKRLKLDITRRWTSGRAEAEDALIIAMSRAYPPLTFLNSQGQPSGLLVDMWRLWSQKTGRKIRFLASTWADTLEALRSGEADIHSGLFRNESRAEWMSFPRSLYETPTFLFRRSGPEASPGLTGLAGRRVGVVAGSHQESFLRTSYPEVVAVSMDATEASLQALIAGRIEAFVDEGPTVRSLVERLGVQGQVEAGEAPLFVNRVFAGTLQGRPELAALVEGGFALISAEELAQVESRWIAAPEMRVYRTEGIPLNLTESERAWVAANPVLRVHNETDWPPFNFFADGRPQGFSIDYMNLLAQKAGLRVDYETGPTWSDFLDMMKRGDLDVMLNIVRTPNRLEYLAYTKPYVANPNAILSRREEPYAGDLSELFGKTVAMPKGFFQQEILTRDYPRINQLLVDDVAEAMKAVSFGRADAAVGELAVFKHLIARDLMNDLVVSGELKLGSDDYASLRIATRKEAGMLPLVSILEKAMAAVTPEELAILRNRWIGDTDAPVRPQLSLTDEEQAWIRGHPELRMTALKDWPPFEYRTDQGDHAGIAADLIRLIGERLGLGLRPVFDEWDTSLENLKAGRLDLAPSIYRTPEREHYLLFTEPFLNLHDAIVVAETTQDIAGPEDLNGKTVAVEAGFYTGEILRRDHPDVAILSVENTLEALKAVSAGRADAYVGTHYVAAHLIGKFILPDLKTVGFFGDDAKPVHMAVPMDLPILRDILNKGLASVTEQEKQDILRRYIQLEPSASPTAAVNLSPAERRWLEGHPVIRLGVDPEFAPFEFVDAQGAYTGMASDYARLIEDRLGVELQVVSGLSSIEALDGVKTGQVDVLPAASRTPERQGFMNFVEPHMSFPTVIITREDHRLVTRMEDLAGAKVALSKGYAVTERALAEHPDMRPVSTRSPAESLQAVAVGEAEATVMNLASAAYLIRDRNLGNLKIAAPAGLDLPGLSFGVRKDWPELVPILEKALASITPEEETRIRDKWVHVDYRAGIDLILVLQIAGAAATAVLVVVVWNRRLHREVVARRQAEAAAEAATRAKSDFLASMSHEIRTPMNAVLGLAHLALKTRLTRKQREYLEGIRSSGENLLTLINDVLDFSKIEAGKLTVERVAFRLDEVMDHVNTVFAHKAQEKGLRLTVETDSEVPASLKGDPLRLGQVLVNLVGNAVKFTERGAVVVACRVTDERRSRVNLEFSVTDTGIGMTPETQSRLFSAFSQGDGGIARRYGGTGLGLSIAKRLVGLMGGTIRFDSSLGQGTTFTFDVWLDREETIERPPAKPILASDIRGMKVLVADDDEAARIAFRDALEDMTFDVMAVASGEEALRVLHAQDTADPFRVVVMDYVLPGGMDGLQATEAIKRSGELTFVPAVVLVTADRDAGLQDRAETAGADGLLNKPITPFALLEAVVQAVEAGARGEAWPIPLSHREQEARHGLAGRRLALVEDNEINREVAVGLLEAVGASAVAFASGPEAVARFADPDDPPRCDAVLMDLQMPEMDGFEATRRIRALPGYADLPIIAMTANVMADDRDKCLAAGMNDYVGKPIDPDTFYEVLIRWIGGSASFPGSVPSVAPDPAGAGPEPLQGDALPGLDLAIALRNVAGNRALLVKLMGTFLRDHGDDARRLGDALDADDLPGAQTLSHTLKGLAGTLGATDLQRAAADLDAALKAGISDAGLRAAVEQALPAALESLRSFVGQHRDAETIATSPAEDLEPLFEALAQEIDRLSPRAEKTALEIKMAVGDSASDDIDELIGCLEDADFDAARSLMERIRRSAAAA